MNQLSFYLLWETLCFVYNIAVDSVNMDTLGNQSVQILSRDDKHSKKWTETNASSILINVAWFFCTEEYCIFE